MKFTTFLQLFTYVHQSYSFFVFFSFWRSNLPIYAAKTIGVSSDLQQSAICLFLLTNRRLHWLNYSERMTGVSTSMSHSCKKREPDWNILKDSTKRNAAYCQNSYKHPIQTAQETFPSLWIKHFVRMVSIRLVKHYVTTVTLLTAVQMLSQWVFLPDRVTQLGRCCSKCVCLSLWDAIHCDVTVRNRVKLL